MEKSSFERAEPIIERVADAAENVLDSAEIGELSSLLVELNKALGSRYRVFLDLCIKVFDENKANGLPLLELGLNGYEDGDPYRSKSDTTFQRYVAGGEIEVVLRDYCPRCWAKWEFKFDHRTCADCGATLGKDVKILLDNDSCPECDEGKVSLSDPVCDNCGYRIDPTTVTWG
jgi:hypothetical protein